MIIRTTDLWHAFTQYQVTLYCDYCKDKVIIDRSLVPESRTDLQIRVDMVRNPHWRWGYFSIDGRKVDLCHHCARDFYAAQTLLGSPFWLKYHDLYHYVMTGNHLPVRLGSLVKE